MYKKRGENGGNQKPANVPEIDDLMDFLAERDAARETERRELERRLFKLGAEAEEAKIPLLAREDYEEFLRNLDGLSKTEREVFDLYEAGHRAKDMPKILQRSVNAIKTRNRNIYEKLRVSSCEEPLGCIKMMKEERRI
ncbi:MAG: LuxR C-terminal-related transcriptional regulator [Deltaproteobacteria bacterium]|jgi:ATP/maltotriose-dependent transcriptional regulator MalT|nr:LuxR C-terminal-related transcriptional regulator [Deltaproteobacteria bacterium]